MSTKSYQTAFESQAFFSLSPVGSWLYFLSLLSLFLH
jgi:hypothetical protein